MTSRFQTTAFSALAALLAIGVAAEKPPDPYPLEYWALREVVRNVGVSPDGRHLALMKIPSRDGNPIIEVYDDADLSREPFRVNADPMEIEYFDWAGDRHILFRARQKVRDKIEGFNEGVYERKLVLLDVERKKMKSFEPERAGIVNFLPDVPDKVILAVAPGRGAGEGPSAKIREAFRPLAYYELDLGKGTRELLIRGKLSLGNISFDSDGNPWQARGFDAHAKEYVWYHRKLGETGWEEIHRQHEDDFAIFAIVGFDVDNRDELYVIANDGHDKRGLYAMDVDTGDMALLYRRSDVDIWNVVRHSNRWTHPDRIVGVSYAKDKLHREFFDELEGGTLAQLEGIIPYAHHVRITSRSRDGNTMVIGNTGPRDPGTYYLLKDDRLQVVGSQQPLLESENLADMQYITYKARDGRKIPAYLTVPNGEPPFPLIVMPHGGPFVAQVVGYDEWVQLLANNGYLVLQPQYRGSRNYGLEFYKAGFIDGGQGGYKMQDDKDDGALYLVKQKLADPERMAMVGWSYGGYAAAIAASRTPQIYQCVVAGASVFDNLMQVNYYRFRTEGASKVEQLRFWDDSISPIKEAAKVNVPMLIVHGDVDQRVPPDHVRKYLKLLDEHGKNYQYVELEGADHFTDTLFYDHQLKFYRAMIDFLANDCGPEGL